jgi:hypothetical protein
MGCQHERQEVTFFPDMYICDVCGKPMQAHDQNDKSLEKDCCSECSKAIRDAREQKEKSK